MLQKLEVTSKFFEVHDPITTPWNTFSTKLIAHYTLLISYVFTCYSHFRLPYWLYFSFPPSGYLKISILKTFSAGSQTYFQSYESQGQLMATSLLFLRPKVNKQTNKPQSCLWYLFHSTPPQIALDWVVNPITSTFQISP